MTADKDQVVHALRQIEDPELRRDIVGLNMVQRVEVADGRATVDIKLPQRAGRFKEQFRAAAAEKIAALGLEPDVTFSIELSAGGGGAASPNATGSGSAASGATPGATSGGGGGGADASASNNPLPNVKHIIAVGAGKGGVGKSTVAVNLAVGLSRAGAKVGLMDGDIYGPSLPTMLGTDRYEVKTINKMIVPFELHGIKCMTIGALVEDDKPLIWRGPMAHGAFQQLATQTDWGELDYLIIDLPPGTGDVP